MSPSRTWARRSRADPFGWRGKRVATYDLPSPGSRGSSGRPRRLGSTPVHDDGTPALEAAFFDLDKTVIAKAAMAAYLRPFSDAGLISKWLLARAAWSHFVFQTFGADDERMRRFRESALRATRGWDQARVSALVRDNLHEVIEPIVYEEALDLIREHRDAGRRVFIVSASPIEVVEPLGAYLGVDEAIATRAKVDAEGRYTGEVDFYSYGPYKVDAMQEIADREGIDLAASFAYSDSATDVPMLAAVGHPVAVNPDRDLAKVARQRGWEVRRFERPVPLRERAVVPPPVRSAVLVGAVVGVAGAGAGAWWWRRRVPPRRDDLTAQLVDALTEAREQLAETRRALARSRTGGRLGDRGAPRRRLSPPAPSSRRTSRGARGRRGRSASSWGRV